MSDSQPQRMMSARVLIPFTIITMIWGSTWLVITGQLGVVDPIWSVSYRFAIAGLIMLGWAAFRGEPVFIGRAAMLFALLLGIAQFALNFNFVYHAQQHVTSGLVAVVFALLIVPNAVFGRIVLGNPMGIRFVIGSAIALGGLALLFTHEVRADPGAAHETLLGVGLTLCGVMCASVANVMLATERAKAMPLAALLGWAMLWGAGADALAALWTAGPPTFDWHFNYVAGLLYLSIMASAVAFLLYTGVIRDIGPGKAAFSSVLIPVIAMALSTIFEGYVWSPLSALGGALVLVGMVAALLPARPDPERKTDSPLASD